MKKIKIAGRNFKVVFQKPKNLGQCCSAAGRIVCDLQKIWIDRTNAKGRQQEVLLHEIIHAVDFFGAIGLTEDQTTSLANGLFAVLRENPKVVRFITGKGKKCSR